MLANGSVLAGRYRIDELLAEGGMASVYRAHDGVLDRAVAIKVHRHAAPVDRQRFDREIRTLAGLAHPNLVSVFDAGAEEGEVFVVLELIDGPTLAQRISDQSLDEDAVRRIGHQLSWALEHIHAEGIVHRDIKPSNVMFDRDGRARLGDFGVARTVDATALTAPATTVGTAAYLAPEQLEGGELTTAVDIYALGLVLLECLTGARAFPGPVHEAALARLARDPEIPPEIHNPWPPLLTAMTARRPEARPTASGVGAALAETATTETAATATATATATQTMPTAIAVLPLAPATGARRLAGRGRWVVWMLLALLAAIATIALLTRDRSDPPASPGLSTVPPDAVDGTTTAPAPTGPVTTQAPQTDCAALEAEKDALEARKREINEDYRDDRETRERLRDEVEVRRQAVEGQLREHCR